MDILQAIGNTSLVQLRKVVPAGAALQIAERLGSGAKVVTLMVDSGLKYLSTDVHRQR